MTRTLYTPVTAITPIFSPYVVVGTDPIIPLLYEAASDSCVNAAAASTSCSNTADASSAAGQLKEIDALPAIEGLLCVSPVLYRD